MKKKLLLLFFIASHTTSSTMQTEQDDTRPLEQDILTAQGCLNVIKNPCRASFIPLMQGLLPSDLYTKHCVINDENKTEDLAPEHAEYNTFLGLIKTLKKLNIKTMTGSSFAGTFFTRDKELTPLPNPNRQTRRRFNLPYDFILDNPWQENTSYARPTKKAAHNPDETIDQEHMIEYFFTAVDTIVDKSSSTENMLNNLDPLMIKFNEQLPHLHGYDKLCKRYETIHPNIYQTLTKKRASHNLCLNLYEKESNPDKKFKWLIAAHERFDSKKIETTSIAEIKYLLAQECLQRNLITKAELHAGQASELGHSQAKKLYAHLQTRYSDKKTVREIGLKTLELLTQNEYSNDYECHYWLSVAYLSAAQHALEANYTKKASSLRAKGISVLENASKKFPSAYVDLADYYEKQGDLHKAFEYAEQATDSTKLQLIINTANHSLNPVSYSVPALKNYTERSKALNTASRIAIALAQQYPVKSPKYYQYRLKAFSYQSELYELNPNNAVHLLNMANALYLGELINPESTNKESDLKKQQQLAAQYCNRIIKIPHEQLDHSADENYLKGSAYYILGEIAVAAHDYEIASRHYQNAIKEHTAHSQQQTPNSSQHKYTIGCIFVLYQKTADLIIKKMRETKSLNENTELFTQAWDLYHKAIELDPVGNTKLGDLYLLAGNYAQALACYHDSEDGEGYFKAYKLLKKGMTNIHDTEKSLPANTEAAFRILYLSYRKEYRPAIDAIVAINSDQEYFLLANAIENCVNEENITPRIEKIARELAFKFYTRGAITNTGAQCRTRIFNYLEKILAKAELEPTIKQNALDLLSSYTKNTQITFTENMLIILRNVVGILHEQEDLNPTDHNTIKQHNTQNTSRQIVSEQIIHTKKQTHDQQSHDFLNLMQLLCSL